MLLRYFILLSLGLFLTACKQTNRDIGHEPEMIARIDAFIEEMAAVQESFPMEPQPISSEPEESLRFFGADSQNSNALLVDTFQLAFIDSDVGFKREHFVDVGPRIHLVNTLEDRHDGQKEAAEGFREELEEILALRFIVAVFVMYDEPVIDEDQRLFTGGGIDAIVSIYDRKNSIWLGGFRCKASPPKQVDFKINADWKYRRDGNFYLKSATEAELEKQIREKLLPYTEKSMSAPVENSGPNSSAE